LAGLASEAGYNCEVRVVVEPVPPLSGGVTRMLDAVVEAEIGQLKFLVRQYHEFSRVETTIGGREVVIVDCEGDFPGFGKRRQLQMITFADRFRWVVTCLASPEKFSDFEDDLYTIVRSLRILE